MKLYITPNPTGTLPSLWDGLAVGTDGGGTVYHNDLLVLNKPLPFYQLQTSPVIGATSVQLAGLHYMAGAAVRDYTPQQQVVYGVPLSGGGLITYEWVFSQYSCAYSGYRDVNFSPSGIQGVGYGPYIIYVYRPSTQSVVGEIARYTNWNSITALYEQNVSYIGGGGDQFFTNWKATVTDSYRGAYFAIANVTAEAGDIVCYEMWSGASTSLQNLGQRGYTLTFDIGWPAGVSVDQGAATNINGRGANNFLYWDDLKNTTADVGVPYSPAAINLTNIDPGTGPKISLTFDGPVTADPPTIGAASSGVAVTSATQVDSTHIDLNLAIAPTEVLTGEAQACNAFAAPTGGTATDIEGGV